MGDLGPYQLVYEVMWRALPKNSLTSAFVCKIWYLYWSVGFLWVMCTLLHQSDRRDNQHYRVLSGEKAPILP